MAEITAGKRMMRTFHANVRLEAAGNYAVNAALAIPGQILRK
jgi:hypothetical protein